MLRPKAVKVDKASGQLSWAYIYHVVGTGWHSHNFREHKWGALEIGGGRLYEEHLGGGEHDAGSRDGILQRRAGCFPSGLMARTLHSRGWDARVHSLGRKLDPTRLSWDLSMPQINIF